MGYDAGLHLYAYVGNDPVNNTDPKGEDTFTLAATFDLFAIGGAGGDVGFFFNPRTSPGEPFDFGFFSQIRAGIGGDLSVGIEGGFLEGPSSLLSGKAINVNAGAGIPGTLLGASATKTFVLGNKGKLVQGGSFAIEAGPLPVSGSLSVSNTRTFGFQQVLALLQQLLGDSGEQGSGGSSGADTGGSETMTEPQTPSAPTSRRGRIIDDGSGIFSVGRGVIQGRRCTGRLDCD